jgi:hypothetical protein
MEMQLMGDWRVRVEGADHLEPKDLRDLSEVRDGGRTGCPVIAWAACYRVLADLSRHDHLEGPQRRDRLLVDMVHGE